MSPHVERRRVRATGDGDGSDGEVINVGILLGFPDSQVSVVVSKIQSRCSI
jgi:hypothetical protein